MMVKIKVIMVKRYKRKMIILSNFNFNINFNNNNNNIIQINLVNEFMLDSIFIFCFNNLLIMISILIATIH